MALSLKGLATAALAVCATVAVHSIPAEAQVYYGRPGFYSGYAPGYGYRPVGGFYGHRYGWHGGYRPAYWGPRYGYGYGYGTGWGPRYRWGYGGGYYPYGYYRSYDGGGAVAAGLIGGLALGAIINAATRPAYARPAAYPAYNNCFFERRRIVTRTGRAVIRRVRTCY